MAESVYLRLRGLAKSYDERTHAVESLDMDIARGEFVTFLGPSGSGKTTTLMMIAGFEEPTKGQIELGGHDLTRTPPYRRNIGIVFQNYALFPHMTVAQNVGFPLKMRSTPQKEIDERVGRVLELVNLSGFAERRPRQLSGGQQQRVALARGLVFDPDLLLLDEPLGALDKNLREQMQLEIKRVHKASGVTMIYVTHDQSEAMTMSDRVAVFRAGRLEQIAPPLAIYDRPASRFVGEFIGDSNFVSGRVAAGALSTLMLADGTCCPLPSPCEPGLIELMVRPERIAIVGDGAAPAGFACLPLQIETIIRYGDSTLLIGLAAGQTMRVRVAGILPAHIVEGAGVHIAWDPTHSTPLTKEPSR